MDPFFQRPKSPQMMFQVGQLMGEMVELGVGSGIGGSGSRLCLADSIARDDLFAGHAGRRGSGLDSVGNPRFQRWGGRCSAGPVWRLI